MVAAHYKWMEGHVMNNITSQAMNEKLEENFVQLSTLQLKYSTGYIQSKVAKFLARYGITPQLTTVVLPVELTGRKTRSKPDYVKPDLLLPVLKQQCYQKHYHSANRNFDLGNPVYFRNYNVFHYKQGCLCTRCYL